MIELVSRVELPPRRAFRPADPAAQGRALRRTSKTHTSVPRSGFGIRGSGGLFEGDRPVLHLRRRQIRGESAGLAVTRGLMGYSSGLTRSWV
jgi:hypothetical protein